MKAIPDSLVPISYPPVYFIIMNRYTDMFSMLLKNYFYSGLFYDVLKNLDQVMKFESENQKGEKVEATCQLTEKDPIWLNYKYQDIDTT